MAWFKFCRKTVLLLTEIIVGVFLLGIFMMIIALWKLSSGPVDLTFAAEHIKSALVDENAKTKLVFKSIVAEWPDYQDSIVLGLSGVELIDGDVSVLEIPRLGVGIAKAPLLIGLIKPEAIIVSNPSLRILRSESGSFHFLVTDDRPEQVVQRKNSGTFKDIGESFFKGGILPDYPALAPLSQLETVSVRDAKIYFDDRQSGIHWMIDSVNFDLDRAHNNFDLSLSYREQRESADSLLSSLYLSLEREKQSQQIEISGTINSVNSATLAKLVLPASSLTDQTFMIDGQIFGQLDALWTLQNLEMKLSSDKGTLSLDEALNAPLTFSNLTANLTYNNSAGLFEIKNTALTLNDTVISLSGRKKVESGDPYFPLTVSIPKMNFSVIHKLWPEAEKDTVFGEWMTQKLSDAEISDLQITLPLNIYDFSDVPADKINAQFSYKNLTADYRSPLIPVHQASGTATIKNDILDISVDSGKISDLTIHKGRVSITKLTHPTDIGDVTIDANLSGNLSTVLDYISREPIHLGGKIGLKKEDVRGQGIMTIGVQFPALADLPAEDVKVVVKADLQNILLPKIVRGLDLSGGPFALDVSDGAFSISGKGKLSGREIDLMYSEYLNPDNAPYASKIKANLVADKDLRDHFGVHLTDFIHGNVPIDIDYIEQKVGETDIDIVADLTPIRFFVDPLGYSKNQGIKGTATATAIIRHKNIQSIKNLNIDIDGETSARGDITFGTIDKEWDVTLVKLPHVKIGQANDFSLLMTQKKPSVLDFEISGKKFDARPFLENKKTTATSDTPERDNSSPSSVSAYVSVNRLITGDRKDQFLIQPKISIKTTPSGDISYLDIAGQTPNGVVTLGLKKNSAGLMGLDITSSNAGEMLYALDLYTQMVGGKLHIRGAQIPNGGINDITGQGNITNFTIVKAPVLAKLINLFSLSGLVELLQNKGIEFSKLKTRFEWKNSNDQRVIHLKDGRTAGASIGLSFNGTINQTKSTMNLEGTVVPMSEVNGFLAKIPVLGNLLGGSSGGLIAATYTMKGPSDDPTVFVNPLSVLAPGFIRSILFEGDTDFDENENDSSSTHRYQSEKPRYNQ